ncbi:MAG: hypothetical protein AB7K24_24480 [Gemmataceae bacterium]
MTPVPASFLLRVAYPCRYLKKMPDEGDRLFDLPETYRVPFLGGMDRKQPFADVRLAWNELGIGLQVEVTGKEQELKGDATRPRSSDGVTVWIDTRDARTSHRASRYCLQFHLLPTGGGPESDQPGLVQAKINRALQDAPHVPAGAVPFRVQHRKSGYLLEAFFSAPVLSGYDPELNRRLGFFYAVRDAELGEQLLSLAGEFPYWEDPSLWSVLELQK